MAQFKHPNVIQLYGIVTDGEQVGIQCGIRCRREVGRDNIHALSLMGEQVQIGCRICMDLYTNSLTPPPPPPPQVMLVMELAGNKDLLTHLTTMRPKCVSIQVV